MSRKKIAAIMAKKNPEPKILAMLDKHIRKKIKLPKGHKITQLERALFALGMIDALTERDLW